jgi:hypothetical protein
MMKTTLLLSMIFLLLLSVPGDAIGQPFGGHDVVTPLGEVTPAPVNGRLHFHGNPLEDHSEFESLEHHSYQYYALHGYEHYRSKELHSMDRFNDIRYPKAQPYSRPGTDSFFGVQSYSPLKW